MPTLSRRGFLASLAATVPLAVVVRRAHAAAIVHLAADPATLVALGEVVLPASELGRGGVSRAVTAFIDWGRGYRENAELNHGYGTSRLRSSGPTPVTRWTAQLDDLDAAARTAHGKRFREIPLAQRSEIVRTALAGQRIDRIPAVNEASHVALALTAHFYESAAATDLCYQATIGKQTCRPLAQQARKPLPQLRVRER